MRNLKPGAALAFILMAAALVLLSGCSTTSAAAGRWESLGPEGGRVDSLVFSPGYARDKTVFANTKGGVFRSGNAAQSWTKMTVGPDGESVLSVALSPNYSADKTIFAVTARGHYRSTTNGQAWTLIKKYRDAGPDSPPARLFVSPNYAKDRTVFLSQIGLYKSTNKGRTWKTTLSSVAQLVFSPNYAKDKTILAVYQEGEGPDVRLYLSTDRGQAWTQTKQADTGWQQTGVGWANSAVFSPDYAKDKTAVFSQATAPALFTSTDSARNWSGPATGKISHVAFSPVYRSDKTIFAYDEAGLLKSTDGGKTWQRTEEGGKLANIVAIAVSPGYGQDKVVYLARRDQGLYRSADGGRTWLQSSGTLKNANITSIQFPPSLSSGKTLFAATGNGVYKSIDEGRTWAKRNANLEATVIGAVAPSPAFAKDATIFAANEKNVHKSTNRGLSWRRIKSLAGNESELQPRIVISPSYATDQTLFVGDQHGIYRSANGGSSWRKIVNISNVFYPPEIAVSPNYAFDRIVFTSFGEPGASPPAPLYFLRSIDGGTEWRRIKLAVDGVDVLPKIIRFSPAFAKDKTVFASDSYNIFKSTDSGKTFHRLKAVFNSELTDIVLSPDYAKDKVVLAIQGLHTEAGAYRSTDGGRKWARLHGVGPVVAFSPNYVSDKTLFTDSRTSPGQIFRSTDNAKTFAPLPRRPGPWTSWLQTIVPSPDYAHDKTIFAVPGNGVASYTFAN